MSTATLGCSETFADVERLVYEAVHRWCEKHGGDPNELIADAGASFMTAYNTYRPSKAKFSTWVTWVVTKDLLEAQRRAAKRSTIVTFEPLPKKGIPVREFSLMEFLDELTEDAKMVVVLALDAPRDLAAIMDSGSKPSWCRTVIKDYLLGLGWTRNQITESFHEIARALQ